MGTRKNFAITMAFVLAIVIVEVVNFFFMSWKAILSFPMLFLFLRPIEQQELIKSRSLVQVCLNCGHKINVYREMWRHFDGKLRSQLCMKKNCDCMEPACEKHHAHGR